ncbi:MAG: hypothetical protein QM398_11650 [Thermoproteota archaeon]|nr:hypothetical protein [Thermoproteota archaeon]
MANIIKILKRPAVWITLSIVIISAILTVSGNEMRSDAEAKIIEETKKLNGELSPFEINMDEIFYLYVGERVPFHFTGEQLANGINLSKFITTPYNNLTSDEFHFDIKNGKLQVSATIRDSEGKLITYIVNNTWKTVDPNNELAFWDRNYNAYAFEVITPDYVPILQVAMIGSNRIQLGGLFYTEDGFVRIAPTSDGGATFSYYPKGMSIEEANENLSIPLLFEYPALTNSSNLGKMQNPIYQSSEPLAVLNSNKQIGFYLEVTGLVMVSIFGGIFILTLNVKKNSGRVSTKGKTISGKKGGKKSKNTRFQYGL